MNEQNDKRLHEWVRESMDTYHSPYKPADWARLQPRLATSALVAQETGRRSNFGAD